MYRQQYTPSTIKNKFDSDNIYYNASVYNDTNSDIVAKYIETRSSAIVDNPSEYELAIVRFVIPGNKIPIFFWETDQYSLTLSYGGTDATEVLQYVTNINITQNPNQVFYYQQLVDSINNAFILAYNTLNTAFSFVSPLPTQAPYIIYNQEAETFSVIVQGSYNETLVGAPTIEIYFNDVLTRMLERFYFFTNTTSTTKRNKFIVQDQHNNGYPVRSTLPTFGTITSSYYQLTQEFSTVYLLNTLKKLLITTNNIPVNQENISSINESGAPLSVPVLTDFEPFLVDPKDSLTPFYFSQNGPYRLIDLTSSTPLRTLDFQVWYVDKNRNRYPLYLEPGQELNIKFLFMKKTLSNIANAQHA